MEVVLEAFLWVLPGWRERVALRAMSLGRWKSRIFTEQLLLGGARHLQVRAAAMQTRLSIFSDPCQYEVFHVHLPTTMAVGSQHLDPDCLPNITEHLAC